MSFTYEELWSRSEAFAQELSGHGLGEGDLAMVKCSNHPTDFVALLATWIAGAAAAPVHRTAPATVLDTVQTKAQCRLIVDFLGDEESRIGVQVLDEAAAKVEARRILLTDAALVIFTSGSTGTPKGVVLSHTAFAGKLLQNQRLFQPSVDTTTLLVLNNTFSFGIWVALITLLAGGRLLTQKRFQPSEFLETVASEGVTFAGVVPTMIRSTFATLSKTRLDGFREHIRAVGRLRSVAIGGEPLSLEISAKLRDFLAPAALYDVYGLTETSTSDFVLLPKDYPAHPNSIGQPCPGIEYRIVDDGGHVCAPEVLGELQLKTPYLMAGYLGDEALTKSAFDAGWFRTGDLAEFGEDGFVRVVGRLKEIIVRGANKITPIEIERALLRCSGVADAMVVGMPDPILGERIHALLVPKSDAVIDLSRLQSELARTLERFKCPDQFYIGASLPAGRTGKLDRGEMKRMLLSGAFQPISKACSVS